jgi:prepilin-type N-terminal cleavage/methylation domain-containing protein
MNRGGFTVLEVLVAMLVLAVAGASLTRTFATAGQAAVLFDRQRRAEFLAVEAIEAATAGQAVAPLPATSPWERTVAIATLTPQLRHTTVEVVHRQDARITVRLEALTWVPPIT